MKASKLSEERGKGRGRPSKGARLRPRKEAGRPVVLEMVHGEHVTSSGYGPDQRELADRRLDEWCAEHGYVKDDAGLPGDDEPAPLEATPPAELSIPDLDSSIAEAAAWFLAGRRPVQAAAPVRSWLSYQGYACRLAPVLEFCGDRLIRDVNQDLLNSLATWHSRQVIRPTQRRLAREKAGFNYVSKRKEPKPPRLVKTTTVIGGLRMLRSVMIAVFTARRWSWLPTMTIPEASEEPTGEPITDAQVIKLLRACHGLMWDAERGTWQREPDLVWDPASGKHVVRMRRVVDPITGDVREVPRWRFRRRPAWVIERRKATIRMIVLLLATGSRSGVGRDLTWDKRPENAFIDERLEILHRRGTRETDGGTKKRPPVRILETLRRHLRRWRAEDEKVGVSHVLHQANGTPMESMAHRFTAVARDSGQEDVTLHHLRHTVIARLIDLGFNLVEIANFVGATVETIEKHYNKRKLGQDRVVAALDQRARLPRSPTGRTVEEAPSTTRSPATFPPAHTTGPIDVGFATKVVVAALRQSGETAAAAELERLLGEGAAGKQPPSEPKESTPVRRRLDPKPLVATQPVAQAIPRPAAGPGGPVLSEPKVDDAAPATAVDKASTIILLALQQSDRPLSGGDLNQIVMAEGLRRDRAEQAKVRLKRAGRIVHIVPGHFWSLPDVAA